MTGICYGTGEWQVYALGQVDSMTVRDIHSDCVAVHKIVSGIWNVKELLLLFLCQLES